MMRSAFVDVGDPSAPIGSPAWCKAAHAVLCGNKRRTDSEVSRLKYGLIEFKKFERWKQLIDNDGKPFSSWEDYVQYPEPNGLGMPPATARLVIEELDDSKLLGDVLLGPRGRPKKGQEKGDNITLMRGSTGRAYNIERLKRDGFTDLAAKLDKRKISVAAARRAAGYEQEASDLEKMKKPWLKKLWLKLSSTARHEFLSWLTDIKATPARGRK